MNEPQEKSIPHKEIPTRVNIPENKFENWFQQLSFDDYQKWIIRLNGQIREVPINKRTIDGDSVVLAYDLGGVRIFDNLPPYPEQKTDLLKDSFEAAKNLNNLDRALLLYYSIQEIHPFSDGNGRTGRLIYETIINEGKTPKKDIQELIEHDTFSPTEVGIGRDIFNTKVLDIRQVRYLTNREIAKKILGPLLTRYGSISLTLPTVNYFSTETIKGLSLDELILSRKILEESGVSNFSFRSLVLIKLLVENKNLSKYQFESEFKRYCGDGDGVTFDDYGKDVFHLDAKEAYQNFTVSDVKRLIEIHHELKKEFVKTLIDIFINPQLHQVYNQNYKKIPIKDLFYLKK